MYTTSVASVSQVAPDALAASHGYRFAGWRRDVGLFGREGKYILTADELLFLKFRVHPLFGKTVAETSPIRLSLAVVTSMRREKSRLRRLAAFNVPSACVETLDGQRLRIAASSKGFLDRLEFQTEETRHGATEGGIR